MSDPDKAWSALEALTVYCETVKPKTLTLYEDAMKRTRRQSNLYQMMGFMLAQVIHDMYTTQINMNKEVALEQWPTEAKFVEQLFTELKQQHIRTANRQNIINDMKKGILGET